MFFVAGLKVCLPFERASRLTSVQKRTHRSVSTVQKGLDSPDARMGRGYEWYEQIVKDAVSIGGWKHRQKNLNKSTAKGLFDGSKHGPRCDAETKDDIYCNDEDEYCKKNSQGSLECSARTKSHLQTPIARRHPPLPPRPLMCRLRYIMMTRQQNQ